MFRFSGGVGQCLLGLATQPVHVNIDVICHPDPVCVPANEPGIRGTDPPQSRPKTSSGPFGGGIGPEPFRQHPSVAIVRT